MAEQPPVDLQIEGLHHAVEIGIGGFATVYRADQPAFRRTVAVKVLEARGLDQAARERFERECQAMGSLSEHPNIVTVYGAGFSAGGRPYLVMAYLPGGSLQDRLNRQGPLPWQEATLYGVHLAGALETAHRVGIVHRDIKPGNVLMSSYGDAQLTDFGIARIAGGHETRSGVVTASMSHAPPEVLDGARPTVAADVYSLGSMLFQLLAGRPAFASDEDESMVPMLRRILTEPPPDLRPRGVPDAVCRVIEQALAKRPEDRPRSAYELGRTLQEARRGLGLEPGKLTVPSGIDPLGGAGTGPAPTGFVAAPVPAGPPVAAPPPVPPSGRPPVPVAPLGPPPVAEPRVAPPVPQPARAVGPPAVPAVPPVVAEPEPLPPPRRRGGVVVTAVIAVVVVLAAAGVGAWVVVAANDDDVVATGTTTTTAPEAGTTTVSGTYTAAVESNFVDRCAQNDGNTRLFCRCVFDQVRTTVPYAEFVEIERLLDQGADIRQTAIGPIIASCQVKHPGSVGIGS